MAKHLRDCTGEVCGFPDCGKYLVKGNTTGLCKKHNHAVGLCKCFQCMGGHGLRKKPRKPPPAKPAAIEVHKERIRDRPGFKVVEIPEHTTTAVLHRSAITMRAFPWEGRK